MSALCSLQSSEALDYPRSTYRACLSVWGPSTIYRSVLRLSRFVSVITCCTVDRDTRNSRRSPK